MKRKVAAILIFFQLMMLTTPFTHIISFAEKVTISKKALEYWTVS